MPFPSEPRGNWPFVAEVKIAHVQLRLGGKLVNVMELTNSPPATMLVSSDMFDAILEEQRNGEAKEAR